MYKLDDLRKKLRKGKVYRREDLAHWSKSVDRHLVELLEEGKLKKLAQGLYYVPNQSAFGSTPPDEDEVIKKYLKGDDYLLTSPNYYNTLGLGTTQLYNRKRVYNHKKHEDVQLGNKIYEFRRKSKFPKKLSQEYLVVDLLNNLKNMAEDQGIILHNLKNNIANWDKLDLKKQVQRYGSINTRKIFEQIM